MDVKLRKAAIVGKIDLKGKGPTDPRIKSPPGNPNDSGPTRVDGSGSIKTRDEARLPADADSCESALSDRGPEASNY